MVNAAMNQIGRIESVWRYPVKSMRGEELTQIFLGFAGVYGDRSFAFGSSAAPSNFPYLTGREKQSMLLYRPLYRDPSAMAHPSIAAQAEGPATDVTEPVLHRMLDVRTPGGECFAIDDPLLIDSLREGLREKHEISLLSSHRSMADAHPVSLISLETVRQLSDEAGFPVDKRRFRSNLYAELDPGNGFKEDEFVGKRLQIGQQAVLAVLERDVRCKMITLDPDTAEANPNLLRLLARSHDQKAGVYASVLVEGMVRSGDRIVLLD